MNKLIWFTTIFVLFLVFILPAIALLPINMVSFNDQPGYSGSPRKDIYGNNFITQEFTSQADNLVAIATTVGNPNLKNRKDVILTLYDEEQNLIRTSIVNGSVISDGRFLKFIFDPIKNSKGQKYLFSISSPQAMVEEIVRIYVTREVPEWFGRAKYNNDLVEGGIPFVTFHKSENKLKTINNVYFFWLKRIFGQSKF